MRSAIQRRAPHASTSGADHPGERSSRRGAASLQSHDSEGSPVSAVSAVSTTVEGLRRSGSTRRSERLTNEQGTDQARSDAIEAQNLAESARECAAAAGTAAARSTQAWRVRHLDPLVSRSATPSREERGPLPTRRQR
ncbi:hypothetical protein PR001_g23204 [Phytophthora rubi]|uniref:Uncharacterized protein n=1 Tax=Phytophthora rubi TaxID=129364 RepID=A0A6A3IQH2_9STRA|nr:hypothetical protein PR001_g23204 [Phytophthora rubi]